MPSVTERNPGRNGTYYIDEEVADLLGISLGRLRNKLCAGNPLPPRIEPPGCRAMSGGPRLAGAVHDQRGGTVQSP